MRAVWTNLDAEQRTFVVQFARYGLAGVVITIFQILIYNLFSSIVLHWSPLVSTVIATAAAMLLGYSIHSRFTFSGHGSRDNTAQTVMRFVVVNLAGLVANSIWVWLLITKLHLPRWTPSLPMFFVTPAMLFWLNRIWVFG